MSTKSNFDVYNQPTSISIAEMHLWAPEQGTGADNFPVELDVEFFKEVVKTQKAHLDVWAAEAEVKITISGGSVVRGSRYGEKILTQGEIAKLEASDSRLQKKISSGSLRAKLGSVIGGGSKIETGIDFGVGNSVSIESEGKGQLSSEKTLQRVVARPQGRWQILEPTPPGILDGKYLGLVKLTNGEDVFAPLCQVVSSGKVVLIRVWLRIPRRSLKVRLGGENGDVSLSRNKEIIVQELVRRAKVEGQSLVDGEQLQGTSDYVDVGFAEIKAEYQE